MAAQYLAYGGVVAGQGDEIKSRNQLQAIYDSQMSKKDECKVKKTVCIHWMSNQCKKGDKCEFLHVYDEERIPPCRYFMKDQ